MNIRKSPLISILLLSLLKVSTLSAVLHPSVHYKEQEKATEALTIKITSRKSTPHPLPKYRKSHMERLEATVISVTRSKSKLKKGDTIVITYLHKIPDEFTSCLSNIPIVEVGTTYPAWFTKSEKGTFSPAAQRYSFKSIPVQWQEKS